METRRLATTGVFSALRLLEENFLPRKLPHVYSKFYPSRINEYNFWLKKHKFSTKKGLRKCYYFVRILQQVYHLIPFLGKKSAFQKQTFFQENSTFLSFLRNCTISVAFYGKFAILCWSKNVEARNCTIFDFPAIGN